MTKTPPGAELLAEVLTGITVSGSEDGTKDETLGAAGEDAAPVVTVDRVVGALGEDCTYDVAAPAPPTALEAGAVAEALAAPPEPELEPDPDPETEVGVDPPAAPVPAPALALEPEPELPEEPLDDPPVQPVGGPGRAPFSWTRSGPGSGNMTSLPSVVAQPLLFPAKFATKTAGRDLKGVVESRSTSSFSRLVVFVLPEPLPIVTDAQFM